MSSRIGQPDTAADVELRACLDAKPPKSFVMIAGAGSGKTTSLVKALAGIIDLHGARLRRHRQRVACITYTEVAAEEIWKDVGNNPLVHVSTIHSFLWLLLRPFQADIRSWVVRRIQEKIDDGNEKAANFGPRVQARTREKNARDIERHTHDLAQLNAAPSFTYGTGSNYPKGILGHDDIVRMASQLLTEKPLLRTVVSQQFPFIFVDESQDTMQNVVEALLSVQASGDNFCLGFFGDPMQKIYTTGMGEITAGEGWSDIKKPENFRCAQTILAVANSIRRDGDGLQQTRGRMVRVDSTLEPVVGTARMFILPADDARDENLARVRQWISDENADDLWTSDAPEDVKVLVIVHRMAAKRLGFGELYAALNDGAPSAIKDGFGDATSWPLRPLWSLAVPLVEAVNEGRSFDAMAILRQQSPRLEKEALKGVDVSKVLAELKTASKRLAELMSVGSDATIRNVLDHIRATQLVALDHRIVAYLDIGEGAVGDDAQDGEDETDAEVSAMNAFLQCKACELWGYAKYVRVLSPFSTHQGVKGAEFPRVLVVLDDEEGKHNQFSYEKLLGIKDLSDTDTKNIAEGKESVLDRTRRLLYVCCTRALSDLAVVLITADPAAAKQRAIAANYFNEGEVRTLSEL